MNTTCYLKKKYIYIYLNESEQPIFTLGNPLSLGVIDLTASNITQLNMYK